MLQYHMVNSNSNIDIHDSSVCTHDKTHPSLKVSFSAVLQLRFFFFQKNQPRFQSVEGDLSKFFCVKGFELFRYLHLQPKVASNQSCWQSLDSGAHRPTRH